jgi:hypothetical protein
MGDGGKIPPAISAQHNNNVQAKLPKGGNVLGADTKR